MADGGRFVWFNSGLQKASGACKDSVTACRRFCCDCLLVCTFLQRVDEVVEIGLSDDKIDLFMCLAETELL